MIILHWTLADHGFWEIQDHCKQYCLDKLSAFFEGTLKGGCPSVSLPTNPTKATEPHQRNMVDPRPRSSGRLLPCLHIAQSREAICTGRGLAASNKPPSGLSCLGAFGVGVKPQEPRPYLRIHYLWYSLGFTGFMACLRENDTFGGTKVDHPQ